VTEAPATKDRRTKKMLVTKTFIDDDGFEVTQDVMEEVEVGFFFCSLHMYSI